MDAKTHKNTAEVECRWMIGLLFSEGISYVTKVENYPEKCFYWEAEKEPLYFDSKRSADDYAFGMLLNGYPAVVMELPKAIIIKNNSKERKESERCDETKSKAGGGQEGHDACGKTEPLPGRVL